MATALAHGSQKKKKKTQTTLDTRAVESKPGKAKKGFSANIFSLLIYHAHIWGGWRWNGRVSDFSAVLFFHSLLYRRYLPPGGKSQVGTRDAKPLCKMSKVGRKRGGGISQTSAGYLWEALCNQMRSRTTPCALVLWAWPSVCFEDGHLWRTKKALFPCCLEATIIQQSPGCTAVCRCIQACDTETR